jgi:CDGSH-type Zn-finger protein/truncated hemoglobin YjbI/ferredoxin
MIVQHIDSLLTSASLLADRLRLAGDEGSERVSARLRASVIRPLEQVVPRDDGPVTEPGRTAPDQGSRPSADGVEGELWALAKAATAALAEDPGRPELAEAAAALQDLAIIHAADETAAAERLAELRALQAGLRSQIQVAADGPYLVTSARRVLDWLGLELPPRPQLALCRCGRSQLKPLCDGSHAAAGFTGAKDPNRVPDRRDAYAGQQVDILDNRGTCQHAGYCTDRLPTVFHPRGEPFVTASGGRMDEIIRAVRDCPSGALSYAIDGEEARDAVDSHGQREQTVEVTKDGPYRVTGGIPLVDHDGSDVARNQGASYEHYALCRCGQSQNKPFCSGMHWYVDFRDPVPDPDRQPTIFEWAGGLPALTRMTRLFYEKYVPADPLLAPLFATMSPDHPQRVAKWLAEVFCGPKAYSTEYGGYPRMLSQHLGKRLTEEQRTRWVALLLRSAQDAGLPNDAEFRSAFSSYIEWGSRLAVENSQAEAHPPEHMPMPHWDWNTAAGPPGSRVSALAPPQETETRPVTLPADGEPVRFDAHVKTMFRSRDRQSMLFAFDLWSYDDVAAHADAILARLRDGTMPCDGAWPQAQIEAFARWTETGKLR